MSSMQLFEFKNNKTNARSKSLDMAIIPKLLRFGMVVRPWHLGHARPRH